MRLSASAALCVGANTWYKHPSERTVKCQSSALSPRFHRLASDRLLPSFLIVSLLPSIIFGVLDRKRETGGHDEDDAVGVRSAVAPGVGCQR